MPKISIYSDFAGNPNVDIVRDDLQNELSKLSYLLEGRIDDENLLAKLDGASSYKIEIPSKIVVDGSDSTRPVDDCMKFYGYQGEAGTYSVTNTIWDRATDLFYENRKLTFLSNSTAWSITKDVLDTQSDSTQVVAYSQQGMVRRDPVQNAPGYSFLSQSLPVETSVYTKRIVLAKPVNYKVYTYNKFFEDFGTLPFSRDSIETLTTRYGSSSTDFLYNFGNGHKVDDPIVTMTFDGIADFAQSDTVFVKMTGFSTSVYHEQVVVDVSFMAIGFDADEYANIQVSAEVLCEVLP